MKREVRTVQKPRNAFDNSYSTTPHPALRQFYSKTKGKVIRSGGHNRVKHCFATDRMEAFPDARNPHDM
jgi:hypothetical protein